MDVCAGMAVIFHRFEHLSGAGIVMGRNPHFDNSWSVQLWVRDDPTRRHSDAAEVDTDETSHRYWNVDAEYLRPLADYAGGEAWCSIEDRDRVLAFCAVDAWNL